MSNLVLEELQSLSLFNIIPDACLIFNKNWYIVKMNEKAKQLFLLPEDYMMSKPFWEVAPQYINTQLYDVFFKVQKEKSKMYFEFQGLTSGRWFGINVQGIGDYVIVFFKDITVYMSTSQELLNSEERFSAVFRKSPALMSILRLDNGNYVSVNDAFTKHTGYSLQEVLGKTKEEINILSKSNPEEFQRQYLVNMPVKELSSDQGTGIPPEVQDKIGTPFFTTKEHGTGIGLAMSYSIAERHNAKIKFYSDKKGTTFFVHFPININSIPS